MEFQILQNDPAVVWAFMRPILKEMKGKYTTVEYAYAYSDGPTTQYRQKANFYLLSTEIYDLGYKAANSNFHEAEHGKGIPDGIGDELKREVDRCIQYEADIMNAMTLSTHYRKQKHP